MDESPSKEAIAEKDHVRYIVGIGASAGGLEAIQTLLSSLPSNTGFPYIIVQHLSPDYKSLLCEILSKSTEMPVVQVEDNMKVEPDHVYVIKPGRNMRIVNSRLLLSPQVEHKLKLPIDLFFSSLAEEAGSRAIAIILSGAGADGTSGIRDVRDNDGIIIVQNPENAKFDGMPLSALHTGLVDAMLSPQAIALEIQYIAEASRRRDLPLKTEKQINDSLLMKIISILKEVSNINFGHYKQLSIFRGIERRMILTHREQLVDYVNYLRECPEEAKILSKELLTGITSFFRNPECFQRLKETAIKDLVVQSSAQEAIRVWVAGCSTGEEAYSIAMLFYEVMEELELQRVVKIFATDVDAEAVAFASKGLYNDSIAASIPHQRLERFFCCRDSSYAVNWSLRRMIVFSPHNVFQDPPFRRLNLISCRNLLTYFQPESQDTLLTAFHTSLKNDGYLFLGQSENTGADSEAYPVVDSAAGIFTHRANVKIPRPRKFSNLPTSPTDIDYADTSKPAQPQDVADSSPPAGDGSLEAIDTAMLERFMPPSFIVNEKDELIRTYGQCGNFIRIFPGKVSRQLYDVLTENLKLPVSELLKRAREENQTVSYRDIPVKGEWEKVSVSLTALPLDSSRGAETPSKLCAFVINDSKRLTAILPYEPDRAVQQRIAELERKLNEAELANDELRAANKACLPKEK